MVKSFLIKHQMTAEGDYYIDIFPINRPKEFLQAYFGIFAANTLFGLLQAQ
jgi:hypothetical protein